MVDALRLAILLRHVGAPDQEVQYAKGHSHLVKPVCRLDDARHAVVSECPHVSGHPAKGAGGTATLASATISGDLTVDTSTLKVDSANNRVGILTATPTAPLDILGNGLADALLIRGNDNANCKIRMVNSGASGEEFSLSVGYPGASNSSFVLRSITAGINRYVADQTGAHTWATNAGTAMTLNSTGLGLGASPITALSFPIGTTKVVAQSATTAHAAGNVGTLKFGISDGGGDYSGLHVVNSHNGTYSSQDLLFFTGEGGVSTCTERMRITRSGNVGVGVTPSATDSTYYQALEIARVGQGLTAAKNALTGSPSSWLSNNSYATYSSGVVWNYAISQPAAQYRLFEGQHQWFNAPSGTAGNAITFTQAMTLDASGNLLVGKTASSSTAVGAELRPSGAIISTLAASTNADFALYTYSTGAGAARFYVGMSGTVFATNTTISAISDQRLKENVQDIDVGLGAILALKPRKFDWKTGKGKDIKGDRGFIAQEFETVFPQLVDEWADPAPEGEAPYKSVRQDLIPVLVKAIQELTARVQTLEAK